jgi:hypothetical protein
MDARKPIVALATAAAVAGCGHSSRTPIVTHLPLVRGTTVIVSMRECNRGANAYCSAEMVVQGSQYTTPKQLLFAERDYLRGLGWTSATPATGVELAAESPGHKLRVTYATALQDLKGIDLGWIARPWPVTSALDRAVFDHVPTMSVLLQIGTQ